VLGPDGQLTRQVSVPLNPAPGAAESLAGLYEIVDRALAHIPGDADRILCVGAPGTVDFDQGVVTNAYAVGWGRLALREVLEERYRVRTVIENDVNLATLGEARFGAGKGVENLVGIWIGTNIGGGIVLNGQLYRGPHGGAGEVGWMVPEPALLRLNHAADGCLESYAGGQGIARQAQRMLRQHPLSRSAMLDAADGDIDSVRAEHVFAAAQAHDDLALAVLERVFEYLSVSVANIVCLLDPEMIVIGGGVARSGEMVVQAVRERIAGLSAHLPQLALSQLGPDAVLFGALALAQTFIGNTRT